VVEAALLDAQQELVDLDTVVTERKVEGHEWDSGAASFASGTVAR